MPLDVWPAWTTTGTTYSATTSEYVWPVWNNNYYQTSYYVSDTTLWGSWNDQTGWVPFHVEPYVPPVLTPEEVEANRLAEEARRLANEEANRQWREREAARVAEEAEAGKRAERLLLQHLTPAQRAEYKRLKRFHVIVGDRKYRVERGWSGNVKLIEAAPEGEVIVESHCIHPREQVPWEDNMLAQKLLLETDEEAFRRISNISRLRRAA